MAGRCRTGQGINDEASCIKKKPPGETGGQNLQSEGTVMQNEFHVNISNNRYIQLLEAENTLLRSYLKPAVETPAVKPYTPPFNPSGCNLNAITKRIHATGISTKQWAKDNGFRDSAVRSVICGNLQSKSITDALIRDGFVEL